VSSLQALVGFKLEVDLVQKILKDYTTLINSGKGIVPAGPARAQPPKYLVHFELKEHFWW